MPACFAVHQPGWLTPVRLARTTVLHLLICENSGLCTVHSQSCTVDVYSVANRNMIAQASLERREGRWRLELAQLIELKLALLLTTNKYANVHAANNNLFLYTRASHNWLEWDTVEAQSDSSTRCGGRRCGRSRRSCAGGRAAPPPSAACRQRTMRQQQ